MCIVILYTRPRRSGASRAAGRRMRVMSEDSYWTHRSRSRRTLLRGTALGGLGIGSAIAFGCGGDDDKPAATTAAGPTKAPAGSGTAAGGGTAAAKPSETPKQGGMLTIW